MMDSPSHLRCPEHDLAAGPDGRCVVCRRAAPPSKTPAFERMAFVVLGALAFGVAGAFTYKHTRALPPAPAAVTEAPRSDDADVLPPPQPRTAPPARSGPHFNAGPSGVQDPSEKARPTASARTTGSEEEIAARREEDADRRRELETAMHRVSIRVYSAQWCPHCTEAKAWLTANRYAYTELDVEASDSNRRAQRVLNPRGGVPTIDVEGEVLVGFGASHLDGAIRRAAQRRVQAN
jgi:glutaredoxin 3